MILVLASLEGIARSMVRDATFPLTQRSNGNGNESVSHLTEVFCHDYMTIWYMIHDDYDGLYGLWTTKMPHYSLWSIMIMVMKLRGQAGQL